MVSVAYIEGLLGQDMSVWNVSYSADQSGGSGCDGSYQVYRVAPAAS